MSAELKTEKPWGWYQILETDDKFQVKRLYLMEGRRISMQRHFHREENWVVVHGTARVTKDGEEFLLTEGQSVYIPKGTIHCLENPGKVVLHVIEVQTGCYLDEDDIERFNIVTLSGKKYLRPENYKGFVGM